MNSPQITGALAGLRVLDLTTMLAGPFCTMMLADQGADVIKIEPPAGDGTRALGPFMPDDDLHAYGGYLQSVNRNKRGLVLDLKAESDRQILRCLARDADVLVENYRAGVMERLGLGYESLQSLNRRLVYACLRGFGDPRTGKSPYVEWPAYDVIAQAMGGLMAITGFAREQPVKVGPGVGDLVPAMMLAFGILAAVRHADRTGEGQLVDIAMYDAIFALCERSIYQYSYRGLVAEPEGNGHSLLCPFGLFQTADGWVSVAAHQDEFWRALAMAIGRPELASDPGYATNAARLARRHEVNAIVSSWTCARTNAEVVATLGGKVPVGPLNDVEANWRDPHVTARQMLASVDQPGSTRAAVVAGSPLRLLATPGGVRRRAPLLDEHRDELLASLCRNSRNENLHLEPPGIGRSDR